MTNSRWTTWAALTLAPLVIACSPIDRFGGAFTKEPEQLTDGLSAEAQVLIDQALSDLTDRTIVDYHVHLMGSGTGSSGVRVNPKMRSGFDVTRRLIYAVYASGAGMTGEGDEADRHYVERLRRLASGMGTPVLLHLLALDWAHSDDATPLPEQSTVFVPNDYLLEVTSTSDGLFEPVVSVHPYRSDAVSALEELARGGARFVKWSPNGQNIDPSSRRVFGYYDIMARYGMTLVAHGGNLGPMAADGAEPFGNPQLLRAALDRGVRVVVTHSAGGGDCTDVDSSDGSAEQSCFDLFMRMLDQPRYKGLLFGGISGLMQSDRLPDKLSGVLEREDLGDRFVHGSDYPAPGMHFTIDTDGLAEHGFLTSAQAQLLDEIYDYNPLLFDLVIKRTVRHPRTGDRFPPTVFLGKPGLETTARKSGAGP